MPRLSERYSLAQFQQRFATEEACLDHLEQARWPYGPVCPRCGIIGESSPPGPASASVQPVTSSSRL